MKKTYGFGLFETMRSYKGKIVYFTQHINRIRKSCRLLGMKFPATDQRLKSMIRKTVNANSFDDVYVKLILMSAKNSSDCMIITKKYTPFGKEKYEKGFSVVISRHRQNNPFLAGVKTVSRFLYERSFEEARAGGFDEALLLNKGGYITEATRSNLFFAKDNELFTPSLDCGCLAGVTRQVILDLAAKYKVKVKEGKFGKEDLLDADEAFLTNSLMGIMPLVSVDKIKIGTGRNKLSPFFMRKYKILLNGK